MRSIVGNILTPVSWDLILHIYLSTKSPRSSLSSPIQHFCSPIPTKSSLPLFSAFLICHLLFLFSLFLSSGLFIFTLPSWFSRHWTPVIHTHPRISSHLLSSPFHFLYSKSFINLFFFSFSTLSTVYNCYFNFSISFYVCISLTMLLLFSVYIFIFFTHPPSFKLCAPIWVSCWQFFHTYIHFTSSLPLSSFNVCHTSSGLCINYILYPHIFFDLSFFGKY